MLQANAPDFRNLCSKSKWLLVGYLVATSIFSCASLTMAQDWKSALQTEQAQNATRINAIDAQAGPLAAQLRQNTAAIQAHNAAHPDGTCTYPQGHPEVCTPWIQQARTLNTQKQSLVSVLQPLANERDRLVARNQEIARRLRCVPLPAACKSDRDCNECSSCGSFDGTRGTGICQPRP